MTRPPKPKDPNLPAIGEAVSVWFQRKVRAGWVIAASMGSLLDPASARVTVRFTIADGETLTRTLPWKSAPAILEAHTPAFVFPAKHGRDTVPA